MHEIMFYTNHVLLVAVILTEDDPGPDAETGKPLLALV